MEEKNKQMPEDYSPDTTVVSDDVQPKAELHNSEKKKEETMSVSEDGPTQVQETEVDPLHEEDEDLDFSTFTKKELLDFLLKLKDENTIAKLDKSLKATRVRLDEIMLSQKSAALDKFLAEGNKEEDFELRKDELDQKLEDTYTSLREKRNLFLRKLDEQKETNYKSKLEILDKIRALVDGEETTISRQSIQKLQEEWKKVGPVPSVHNKTLWASYHALLDRFYDNRNIYFELKDLDRKKNLEQKIELCEKAEALAQTVKVADAVRMLNEYHDEFKHIGPVPSDRQEEIWERFKKASDIVYERRRAFLEVLKSDFQKNYEIKLQFAQKAEELAKFSSTQLSDWNEKSKELMQLQKDWEAVGSISRDKAKQLNRQFWSNFKAFFNKKNEFFKSIDQHRKENLAKKEELIKRAEELQTAEDWDKAANEIKKLQKDWRDIGPVPEKFRKSSYETFKALCDAFFDKKRSNAQLGLQEQNENLKRKLEICTALEKELAQEKLDLDILFGLFQNYHEIGFVPRNDLKRITQLIEQRSTEFINHPSLEEQDKADVQVTLESIQLRADPNADRKIQKKEMALRKQISTMENDLYNYKRNMDFLAKSANADKLKLDYQKRIESAEQQLKNLQTELKNIRQL